MSSGPSPSKVIHRHRKRVTNREVRCRSPQFDEQLSGFSGFFAFYAEIEQQLFLQPFAIDGEQPTDGDFEAKVLAVGFGERFEDGFMGPIGRKWS